MLSLLPRDLLQSRSEQIIASNWMCRAAIGWRLVPMEHAVITQYGSNAKPVVAKDASAALGLNGAMHLYIAPSFERSFIAPEGQRKQFVRSGPPPSPNLSRPTGAGEGLRDSVRASSSPSPAKRGEGGTRRAAPGG